MKIREYKMDDYEKVLELFEEMLETEHRLDGLRKSGKESGRMYMERVLDDLPKHEGLMLVAEEEREIVGFVTAMVEINRSGLFIMEKFGYIGDISVARSWRSKGVGGELMKEALKHLKGLGLEFIKVEVVNKNERARNFYKRLGFEAYEDTLLAKI